MRKKKRKSKHKGRERGEGAAVKKLSATLGSNF
jgi:hypothetical protein